MSWFSKGVDQEVFEAENDLPEDLDIPFNEEDLNDQSLLDELKELQLGGQEIDNVALSNSAQSKTAIEFGMQIDGIIGKVKLDAEFEPHVEFSEEDMNDPTLLEELQAVVPGSLIESRELDLAIPDTSSVISPSPEAALDSKLNLTDISKLQKFIQVEKMKALNKKRAGDKAGALESLKVAKDMERRVSELQSLCEAQNGIGESVFEASSSPGNISKPDPAGMTAPYDLDLFKARAAEFKKAALGYKRENNLSRAREMLTIAKSIQKVIDTVSDGITVADYILPELPVPLNPADTTNLQFTILQPSKFLETVDQAENHEERADTKAAKPEPKSNQTQTSVVSSNELISHLINALESQISTCTKLSAQYFTSNQKDLALEYHKKKKSFMQDKQTLSALKSIEIDPCSLPFKFSYHEHTYHINQSFPDIALDQVEISIEKATDIFVKGVSELESLVCFDFGWPFNSSGTLGEGKGETSAVKGLHPEYNFKTLIKIERTKPFQRYLERKKATFELFYIQKSFFGLMAARSSCGKAVVKLDDLLSKCEIHQVLPLMEPTNPRKPTGSTLEIKIRMRAPLIKPDNVKVCEQWLQIVFGETSSPVADSTTQKALKSRKSPPISPVTHMEGSPISKSAHTAEANDVIDEMAHAFLMPENIASNAVLEHEHKLVIQQIAQGTKSDELLDLKSSYEIKMNMLVTSIQLGTLDMPGYIALVKDAISKTKGMAVAFKKANRIDLAKKALVRVKIMTSEVDEVEQ